MDSRLLFGLGVSCIFGLLRWRFPAVPKPLATFGAVVGIGLLVWAAFPAFDWRWAVALIAIFAAVAALLDALLIPMKPDAASASTETVDQSVTSHGQSGGITARSIDTRDAER